MQRILIIDDDSDILANISEYLTLEGFTIYKANSGSGGISLAKEQIPDLIVCDILMPKINGFQVLRALLDYSPTSEIPFIFSSALNDSICLSEAEYDGADDYIVKPYNPETLLQLIKKWLSAGSKRQH